MSINSALIKLADKIDVDGKSTVSPEYKNPNNSIEKSIERIAENYNGSGGGGGTGGGALIVNVNSSTGAIDKTAKELYDAMDTQIVLFKASVSPAEGVVTDFYAIVDQKTLINESLYDFGYSSITDTFPYSEIENTPCSANDYLILTTQ